MLNKMFGSFIESRRKEDLAVIFFIVYTSGTSIAVNTIKSINPESRGIVV
jgi:hypothetical protein